jgi:hypothetical protein
MKRLSGAWISTLMGLMACGGEGVHSSGPPGSEGGSAGSGESPSAGHAGQGTAGSSASPAGGSGGSPAGGGGAASAGTATGGAGGGNGGNGGNGGSAAAAGQGGMLTTPDALVPIAKAFCAAARSCCMKEQLPSKLDDCESSYATKDDTSQALTRGTVTLDSAGLARCLAAYQNAAEACEEVSVLAACRGVVHGTRAEGQSCKLGLECMGDEGKACLVPDSNPGSVGVCRKISHGAVGAPCEITCRPDESCTWTSYGATANQSPKICFEAEGVYCDTSSDEPQCQPIRAAGAQCTDFHQCGSAGYCDTDSYTCKKLGQLNDPCGMCIPQLSCIGGHCQSPSFTAGPTCDGISLGPY